jgi:tRNA 2-thiocytidine biosynthesis protein TtcA
MSMRNSIFKTHRHDIWSKFIKAIKDYDLIQENDTIAICISGGKDSMLLAYLFKLYQPISEIKFDVKYLVMDPGYKEHHRQQIIDNAKILDIPIQIHDTKIFSIVEDGKNPCYRCARMRRGSLYSFAKDLGCNKIALGHHFDDAIETTLINIFYAGRFGTMLPRLQSTSNIGMELMRPLYLVKEKSIINWAQQNDLTFLNCACNFTEKRSDESKRQEIKKLIKTLSKDNPLLIHNIFKSVENINLTQVMSYYSDDIELTSFLDKFNQE